MSDLLTHWAVFDDTRRLAGQDPAVEPFFLRLLNDHADESRLGAIARKGGIWMPRILKAVAEDREAAVKDETLRRRIAFALGGLLHFPTDYIFKPMMSRLAEANWSTDNQKEETAAKTGGTGAGESPSSIRQISAYYDCHVFRKVYLGGLEEPFSDFLFSANPTEPGKNLENFIKALFQRSLLASHTLSPDMDHFEEWLDDLLEKVQPLYIDIALYANVFSNPDPVKTQQFSVENEFYRDDDPAIQLARAIQKGWELKPGQLASASAHGANTSGYARCLVMGLNLLRETSAFWRGEQPEPPDIRQGSLKDIPV